MDRLEEIWVSTNNSASQPIVIAKVVKVVKTSASQPIVTAESSQIVKESESQPSVIAESSQSQHNKQLLDLRVTSSKEFRLKISQYQNITKCQWSCGKSIRNKDEIIIRYYGMSTWTNKVTGSENSNFGPMYLHFNEECLKSFDDENYYGPGQAFNYHVVTIDPKSKGDQNPAEINLLRILNLVFYYDIFVKIRFLLHIFLSQDTLFFLPVKCSFIKVKSLWCLLNLYCMYWLLWSFFVLFTFFCFYPCFCKAVQVSLNTPQFVVLQNTYTIKPTSFFHYCFFFIWIKVTFFLCQQSKSKQKSRNMLITNDQMLQNLTKQFYALKRWTKELFSFNELVIYSTK